MNRFSVFYLCIVALLFAFCGKKDIDLKKDANGLEYGFYHENKEAKKAETGEALNLSMKYFDENDSLLFDSHEISENFKIFCNSSFVISTFSKI